MGFIDDMRIKKFQKDTKKFLEYEEEYMALMAPPVESASVLMNNLRETLERGEEVDPHVIAKACVDALGATMYFNRMGTKYFGSETDFKKSGWHIEEICPYDNK